MSHLAKAREVFDIELAALKAVRAQLDDAFGRAVNTVLETLKRRGKIVIVGIGKSGNVGTKIAATLTSTGSTAVVLNSVDALHGDVGIVNDGDIILALSYSGESEELLNLLPALKRFSVKIISFTGNIKSSLARHSDLVAHFARDDYFAIELVHKLEIPSPRQGDERRGAREDNHELRRSRVSRSSSRSKAL